MDRRADHVLNPDPRQRRIRRETYGVVDPCGIEPSRTTVPETHSNPSPMGVPKLPFAARAPWPNIPPPCSELTLRRRVSSETLAGPSLFNVTPNPLRPAQPVTASLISVGEGHWNTLCAPPVRVRRSPHCQSRDFSSQLESRAGELPRGGGRPREPPDYQRRMCGLRPLARWWRSEVPLLGLTYFELTTRRVQGRAICRPENFENPDECARRRPFGRCERTKCDPVRQLGSPARRGC